MDKNGPEQISHCLGSEGADPDFRLRDYSTMKVESLKTTERKFMIYMQFIYTWAAG